MKTMAVSFNLEIILINDFAKIIPHSRTFIFISSTNMIRHLSPENIPLGPLISHLCGR